MKIGSTLTTMAVVGAAIGTGLLTANAVPGGKGGAAGVSGADVAVCGLPSVYRWGTLDGVSAYSVGTTSVNLGDVNLEWYGDSSRHPRIPQNAFRYMDGRLTQLGQSWCKDGFCALQQNECGSCQPADSGCPELLGPGCSDPYSDSLNGQQNGLAPRSQCNPATGQYQFPPTDLLAPEATVGRRLRIRQFDLNPNVNGPETRFYMDAFYLHPQDYEAGNHLNNGSYREAVVGTLSSAGYRISMTGNTQLGKPAIFAWEENSSTVEIETVDLPGDGRLFVAHDVIDNGDGTWNYEYAIYNLTSDDSVNAFSVPTGAGVNVLDRGFHDVSSHSGEAYKTYNWAPNDTSGTIGWKTTEYSVDPNANACRWGTMYNYFFVSDAPPTDGTAEFELFKSNGVASVAVRVPASSGNPYDLNGDNQVNGADVGLFIALWGSDDPSVDFDGNGIANGADFGLLVAAWG